MLKCPDSPGFGLRRFGVLDALRSLSFLSWGTSVDLLRHRSETVLLRWRCLLRSGCSLDDAAGWRGLLAVDWLSCSSGFFVLLSFLRLMLSKWDSLEVEASTVQRHRLRQYCAGYYYSDLLVAPEKSCRNICFIWCGQHHHVMSDDHCFQLNCWRPQVDLLFESQRLALSIAVMNRFWDCAHLQPQYLIWNLWYWNFRCIPRILWILLHQFSSTLHALKLTQEPSLEAAWSISPHSTSSNTVCLR